MADLEFVCADCHRFLGRIAADAPDGEREGFLQGSRDRGATPEHHFGWFCSRLCGEAFFGRQDPTYLPHPRGQNV